MNTSGRKKSFYAALLIGIGVMAAIDEIVFHQVLGWHHFYDRATPTIGLMSDGFLHAAELIAIVAGFFLFSRLRQYNELVPPWAWAGFFIGAGGFQVFDGVINHKVLRLHQIRYGVNVIPYDIAWVGFGVFLLLIGAVLCLRTRRISKQRLTDRRGTRHSPAAVRKHP